MVPNCKVSTRAPSSLFWLLTDPFPECWLSAKLQMISGLWVQAIIAYCVCCSQSFHVDIPQMQPSDDWSHHCTSFFSLHKGSNTALSKEKETERLWQRSLALLQSEISLMARSHGENTEGREGSWLRAFVVPKHKQIYFSLQLKGNRAADGKPAQGEELCSCHARLHPSSPLRTATGPVCLFS